MHFNTTQVDKILSPQYYNLTSSLKKGMSPKFFYSLLKIAISITMGKKQITPTFNKQYPIISINNSRFLYRAFTQKNWKKKSDIKKKIEAEA